MYHTNFEGVERYIKSLPPIEMEEFKPKEEGLEEFICSLLSIYTIEYCTPPEGLRYRRTITDIYRLCLKYVAPEVKLIDVVGIIFNQMKGGSIGSYLCDGIDKRVYYWSKDRMVSGIGSGSRFQNGVSDEYNLDYSAFISGIPTENRGHAIVYASKLGNNIVNPIEWDSNTP